MTEDARLNYIHEGFTPDQISEIEEGMKAGIDVSVYARKDFLAMQMRQIRKGLTDNLPMAVYAKPEYDWFQLEEIREGLSSYIDVKKYDSPEIPYDKMRQLRKGLEKEIDLTSYLSLEAGIIRQIRKALISDVDIQLYVEDGYDEEQLEEIRIALQEGLDIHQYVKKEFRGISLHEIVEGLRKNVDVSVYAKEEYSWRQMREIRLGQMHQIDVSFYTDPWYDYRQMQELRLGLEAGLDINNYVSLMYTAKEMGKRRLELMDMGSDSATSDKEIKSGASETVESRDGLLITISADEMEACVRVVDPSVQLTRKDVLRDLKNEGIVYGIDQREVDNLISGRTIQDTIVIARGKPAVQGENGYYEFFFRTNVDHSPKVQADGSVDYRNVDWFEQVKRQQKIAYYHAAGAGEVGYTVTGRRIAAKRGREQSRLRGKGFLVLPDQKTYVSIMDGRIELTDNNIEISKMVEFQEVSLATGNIRFDGNVYVKGNVGDGTTIAASGDVVVDGFVEAATIVAGGNVILRKGMNASGSGSITAGGNIEGKFFEAVVLKAGNDIHANYCMNCEAHADGEMVIFGRNGSVVGGAVYVVKQLSAQNIGNRAGILTRINVGVSEKMRREQREVEDKLRDNKMELMILQNAQADFQEKYPAEIRNTMEMYLKIDNAIFTKNKIIDDLMIRKEAIEKNIANTMTSCIVCSGDLFEGVLIDINGRKLKSNYAKNVTIRVSEGKIVLFANLFNK